MWILPILFILLQTLCAFTSQQAITISTAIQIYGPLPPFAAFVDSVITGREAFTNTQTLVVYIDARRFEKTPNAFWNVIHHEIDHLKGRSHNSNVGDIMSYHLTVTQLGDIVEDPFLW